MEITWELRDARLHNRISDFADSGAAFSVGITASPESRVETLGEGGEDYDEMLVLYQTRNKSEVRRLSRSSATTSMATPIPAAVATPAARRFTSTSATTQRRRRAGAGSVNGPLVGW